MSKSSLPPPDARLPIPDPPQLSLDPVQDIEVGRHQRGDDGKGTQEMTDQHDWQDNDKPATDSALNDILLLGGLGGKRKALHGELKYRERLNLSTTQLLNGHTDWGV